MKLQEILEATATEYQNRKIASIIRVKPEEESDLHWRGHILDSDGQPTRPVGLVVVTTREPGDRIEIVREGARPNQVNQDALDDLASLVLYRQGRGGVLWLNAGVPHLAGGNVLVNAARHFQMSMEREESGMSWNESERYIAFGQFVPVKLAKARRGVVMDWLAACVQEPDQSESQAGA